MTREQTGVLAVVLGLVLVVGAIVLVLPGDAEPTPREPVALVQYVDCSPSMVDVLRSLGDEAHDIALSAGTPGSRMLAGTFAGSTARTAERWQVRTEYDLDLDATGGNERKARELLEIDARKEARRVKALLGCPDGSVPGSPLLSALEAAGIAFDDAALERGVDRHVVLYSDGAIVGDGLDVRRGITATDVRAAVRDWPPRLFGLRGASVWVIGADSGHRGISRETMRRVRAVMERVLAGAGARLEAFGPDAGSYPVR